MFDFIPLDFLTTMALLPLLGAVIVFFMPRERAQLIRWTALGFSLAVLVMSVAVFFITRSTNPGADQWVLEHQVEWFPLLNSSWHVGVDGLSAAMILLTGLLVPLAILISFEIEDRVNVVMALFLFLETGMLGVFIALDLVVFFLFWEIGLVPMYFLIFLWGGENRRYAANKFFLYTMAGSLGLLLSIQYIGLHIGSFDLITVMKEWPQQDYGQDRILGIFAKDVKYYTLLGFSLAFLIKIPAWPFHTWLPDAHTEAPTGGSMLLAGVLLKLGAYGFLRLAIPLFPREWIAMRDPFGQGLEFNLSMMLGLLAILGIVLGALAAWGQTDFKRLVAYSSVNHMGFVVLGLAVVAYMYGTTWTRTDINSNNSKSSNLSLNTLAGSLGIETENIQGESALREKVGQVYPEEKFAEDRQDAITAMNGVVLQMFNHGLTSAGMFLLVGALYHKAHTRDLRRFGGLWEIIPIYGAVLIFVSMASLGLPGLNGFVSEYLIVAGSFKIYPVYVLASMLGLILTGIYILKAIQMVLHGPVNEEWAEYDRTHHKLEITKREFVALAPLMALMLITGLYPAWITDVINQGVMRFFGGA